MLLQTNSYVVPKDRRAEHARLLRRFRQTLARLGCTDFEVYEQVGANWMSDQTGGRFVQIMRFRDRKHQLAVQAAERSDPTAQALVAEFCELINFPYQQENALFAVGYYTALICPSQAKGASADEQPAGEEAQAGAAPSPEVPLTPRVAEFLRSAPPGAAPAGPFAASAVTELHPVELDSFAPHADAAPDIVVPEFAHPPEYRTTEPAVQTPGREPEPPVAEVAPVDHSEDLAMGDIPGHSETDATPAPSGANGNGKYEFQIPDYARRWHDQPAPDQVEAPAHAPLDTDFDDLLDDHFESNPAAKHEQGSNGEHADDGALDAGLSQVLDAGLGHDELDIALPAELIDPMEHEPHSTRVHPLHVDPMEQEHHRD